MRNAWSFIQMENPVTLGKVEGEIVSSQNLSLGRILTWCNLFLWIGTGHRVLGNSPHFTGLLPYHHFPVPWGTVTHLSSNSPLYSPLPPHTYLHRDYLEFLDRTGKKDRRQGKNLSYLGLPPIPSQDYEVNQSGPRDIPLGSAFYWPRLSYKGDSTLLSVEALGEEKQCLHN